jgi:hypothetical protein
MTDKNYWKEGYQHLWKTADEKVDGIIKLIKEQTGKETKKVGFGADTTDFIDGSAADHGHEKGDADLQVVGTDIVLEVTGPNVPVRTTEPLWIRPDKMRAACSGTGKETWIVHVTPSRTGEPLIRVIHCDEVLCRRFKENKLSICHPHFRGKTETYVELPADDSCVRPLADLLARIAGE